MKILSSFSVGALVAGLLASPAGGDSRANGEAVLPSANELLVARSVKEQAEFLALELDLDKSEAASALTWQNDFNHLVTVMESKFPDGAADVWIEHTNEGPVGTVRTDNTEVKKMFATSGVANVNIIDSPAVQRDVSDVVNDALLELGSTASPVIGISVDSSDGSATLDKEDQGFDGIDLPMTANLENSTQSTTNGLSSLLEAKLADQGLPSDVSVEKQDLPVGDTN